MNEQLFSTVQSLLDAPLHVGPKHLNAPTGAKGAYALMIQLERAVDCRLGQRLYRIDPGHYVYAGSANGPGGIDARLRRHFKPEKRLHWHVDQLTVTAFHIDAFTLPGATECDIVDRLADSSLFEHVVTGFGSSDCAICDSHLLKFNPPRQGG